MIILFLVGKRGAENVSGILAGMLRRRKRYKRPSSQRSVCASCARLEQHCVTVQKGGPKRERVKKYEEILPHQVGVLRDGLGNFLRSSRGWMKLRR
jgi:hypothetical protein